MSFTSLTYLIFLPLVFAAYWGSRRQWQRNLVLVVASYFFYAWWDWRFCGLMLGSSLVDYWAAIGIAKYSTTHARAAARRKALLGLSLLVNLGALGFFKYFGFFADNFVMLFAAMGITIEPTTLKVILPAGISFYTFQTMSYTIDVYRGTLPASHRLLDYLAYVSFFPQLVAGPIERAGNMLPQFASLRHFDEADASDGCRQILWGFTKKFAIADNLAPIVNASYAAPAEASGPQLVLATVCFAFQIYCDFSAYSDIAIGSAKLFGIRLMRNFAYPYFSTTIAEFWHRWHISLSTWFRDYVYIPLGGNQVPRWRKSMNVFITFLVSGFWHGASWNFVVWGGLNGAAVLLSPDRGRNARGRATEAPAGARLLPGIRQFGQMVFTFALACLFWVFFRAHNLSDAVLIVGRMARDVVSLQHYRLALVSIVADPRRLVIILALVPFLLVEWLGRRHAHPLHLSWLPRAARFVVYTGLIWATLALAPRASGQFIYFQF